MSFRTTLFILCILFSSLNAFAQLPHQNGQVWREYPAAGGNATPSFIAEYIRRETGEAAWTGNNFGLISCNSQKLYVYHTPSMQQQVAEIVARFMRPETKNVGFVTKNKLYSVSKYAEGITDIRQLVMRYLHPIAMPDTTHDVSAYWIAKDDIPKFWEKLQDAEKSDMRFDWLDGPEFSTLNGMIGNVNDTTTIPFCTHVIPIQEGTKTAYHPVISMVDNGQSMQSFSLLSWDCRTATTDISAVYSHLVKVGLMQFEGADSQKITIQQPVQTKFRFSKNGLVWSTDGMLVVFYDGGERLLEGRVETGVPVLNKIPYFQRLFSNTAGVREIVPVNGILTVQMVEEETLQQAVRQGVGYGNVVR